MDSLCRDGVRLAFQDVAKGAPPILLIHDLGGDHRCLRPQLDHFRRRHRVVAVDLRGHGHSDPLVHPYTPTDFAEDVAWLCYELGVYRPVAVGRGTGGLIAVDLTVRHPDLLSAVVLLEPLAPSRAGACSGGVTEAGDAGKYGSPPATHLAPTNETATAWDRAAPLAQCALPLLCVQSGTSVRDPQSLRAVCPRVVVGAVRRSLLQHGGVDDQANALIEAFLAASVP
jgi:pimeloyl-ACP methyl ester carboxylesterase